MFYDHFEELCKANGTTPVQVRKDLGISQSTMASWKSRGLTPNTSTLSRLAVYFGVSVDEFLGKTPDAEKPDLSEEMLRFLNLLEVVEIDTHTFAHSYDTLCKAFKLIKDAKGILSEDTMEMLRPAVQLCYWAIGWLENSDPEGIYRIAARYKEWDTKARKLFTVYDKLNAKGRAAALERLEEMAELPKFQKTKLQN